VLRDALSEVANQRVTAVELLSKLIYLKQGSSERSDVENENDRYPADVPHMTHSQLGEELSSVAPRNSRCESSSSEVSGA